jgi:hypothetical protein
MKQLFLIVFYSLISFTASAQIKDAMSGIAWLPGTSTSKHPYDPSKWGVWTISVIPSVVARVSWEELEPADGVYNFTYINTLQTLAKQYGKQWKLAVHTGANTTHTYYPTWLVAEGAKTVTLPGSHVTIVLPWDQTFLAKWQSFIAKLGASYDSDPLMRAVQMYGVGRQGECYFADDITDYNYMNANFPGWTQNWKNALITITGYYAQSFPTTFIEWANGRPLPKTIDRNDTFYRNIISSLDDTYNANSLIRFGTQDSGYYYGGGVNTCSKYTSYQQTTKAGTGATAEVLQLATPTYHALWCEVVDDDCLITSNYSAFVTFNSASAGL